MRFVPTFVLALALTGCGQAATASPSMTSAALPSASREPTESPGVLRLPLVTGLPSPLDAGTYLTPEGFEPAISLTLPQGWYGGASLDGLSVGQGFDDANQRFAGAGLYLAVIALPYDEAVAAFSDLGGLTHDRDATTGMVDGHDATTFYAHASGAHVLLDAIAPGSDLIAEAGQEIFIDVNGTTVFIKTEVFDDAGEDELADVIGSIEFPDADT
jgi:hypothetical protein